VARKPLLNKDNTVGAVLNKPINGDQQKQSTRSVAKPVFGKPMNIPIDAEREPIMVLYVVLSRLHYSFYNKAYLRIRPQLGEDEPTSLPYLTPLSDTTVRMTDPYHDQANASFRASVLPQSSIYSFSHIFLPQTTQSDFFAKTTLPLVRDALQGQNALLFTYGVTNSGKTYTVQGGSKYGSAGILPRTLDVIFNSIEGLQSNGRVSVVLSSPCP
jgi:kinesin family protein 20